MRNRLRVLTDNGALAQILLWRGKQSTQSASLGMGIVTTDGLDPWICENQSLSISEQLRRLAGGEADLVIGPAHRLPYPLPEEIELAALCSGDGCLSSGEMPGDELPLSPNWHAVLSGKRRPDLRALFHGLDLRQRWGKVWLVGFGPGDPELMTLKADRILDQVDIIYYDDLIDQSVLARYPGQKYYVGKRKGNHAESQQVINELLYRSAVAGRTVARLKGGDPFIFGRGGEETEYLLRRLVAVEVIPGVSAANAAAAAWNIPLTKRDFSRGVAFRTAHCGKTQTGSSVTDDTLVYYMAATRLAELAHDLCAEGLDPATPVALVENASLANERCLSTSLEKLAKANVVSPVLVIVGKVVTERHRTPTLLFTGPDLSRFRFTDRLFHYPLEAVYNNLTLGTQKEELQPSDLESMDGVVFCSPLTVETFIQRHGLPPSWFLIYAANPATFKALLSYGVLRERVILLLDRESAELLPHDPLTEQDSLQTVSDCFRSSRTEIFQAVGLVE